MMHKSVIVLALLALVFATAHAQDGHPEEPQHKDEHHQEEHHGQQGAPTTPTTPTSAPPVPGKLHFIEAEFTETEGNMVAALEVFKNYAAAVLHDPTITQPKDKKAVDKTVVECAFGGNVDAVIKAHQAFLADLKQPNAQVEDALEKHLKPMLAEDITWMKAFTKRQGCLVKAEANKVVETVLKKTSVQLNPHAPTEKPKNQEKPKKEKKDKKDKKPKKADKKIHPEPQPGAKGDKPEKRKSSAADVLKKLVPGFVKESWIKASTQVSGKYAAVLKAYEERQAKAEHKKQVKAAEYPNFDSKVIVIAQRYPRYKLLFVEMQKACSKEDHCKGSPRLQKIEAVLKEVEAACNDINKAI